MSELLKLVYLPYQSFRGHEESAIVMNFKKVSMLSNHEQKYPFLSRDVLAALKSIAQDNR